MAQKKPPKTLWRGCLTRFLRRWTIRRWEEFSGDGRDPRPCQVSFPAGRDTLTGRQSPFHMVRSELTVAGMTQ